MKSVYTARYMASKVVFRRFLEENVFVLFTICLSLLAILVYYIYVSYAVFYSIWGECGASPHFCPINYFLY